MNPKHNNDIPKSITIRERSRDKDIQRQAVAPYNFVELPEKVLEVSLDSLPKENSYYLRSDNRYTGRIECTLTTESPLYIRCGFTKDEFESGVKSKDLPNFFYTNPLGESTKPVIPGSSLRGMLRNLIEIITFSKIDQVSDHQRLFFRAVAVSPDKDSLGKEYQKYVDNLRNKTIQAGYLKKDHEGWYIQPAKKEQGATFAWVREGDLEIQELIKFDEDGYKPQYIPVSYRQVAIDYNDRAKRLFASDVDTPNTYPQKKGVLVTSGNMKQDNSDKLSPRRNHCLVFDYLVFESDSNVEKLRLDERAIDYYRNALTDFQKESPFSKDWGMLNENCSVVFYYPPENGNKVVFFGQSPNFRIPYTHQDNGYAATVADFIPTHLTSKKENSKIDLLDLADAIFGWVDKKELPENMRQRASRVFVTDAQYQSNARGIWYKGNFNDTITPQILSEPKPTCFQHYLVQPEKDNPQADKAKLKHYASQPESETVIRGHKLYWHKGKNHNFEHPDGNKATGTQVTKIKPINSGVKFKFYIHFENLTNIELGALLWVLDIAQREDEKDKQYRLKLGMGKPLGMGSIKVEPKLCLSDRQQRYRSLFSSNHWNNGEIEQSDNNLSKYKVNFEEELINQLHNSGVYQDFKEFDKITRIQMLLGMLVWEENPSEQYIEQRRYMEIKREKRPRINDSNEYKERPVLPTPLQVMGWNDNRRLNNPLPLPLSPNGTNNIPKPIPKPKNSDVGKPIKKSQQSQENPDSDSKESHFNPLARPQRPKK